MSKSTPTVWEALNEPVVEITDEQARSLMLASIVIFSVAWLAPYWGPDTVTAYNSGDSGVGTIFEQMGASEMSRGAVAGAVITESGAVAVEFVTASAPEWYYIVEGVPAAVVESFAAGANEVLDISGPVANLAEFYGPGVHEVWNGWLELMMDP